MRPSEAIFAATEATDISSSDSGMAINEELVMKCLASAAQSSSDLIISVFDFGGQSVFNIIHHLFLTRNGVYALVFNMEWLLSMGPLRQQCLDYLKFWMNSIIVHTFDAHSGTTAPLILVGTRKDIVRSPADHEKISILLFDTFSRSKAWPSVIDNPRGTGVNGTCTLWFYPVDNTLGRNDDSLRQMSTAVERAMNDGPFTHKKVPLTWLRLLDELLQGTNQSCWYSLTNVAKMATTCGVHPKEELKYALRFLHEMGILLWIDEPGLGEIIIMDAISYLVNPATIVICKHVPDNGDVTHHVLEVHKECNRKHYTEWLQMIERGILSEALLPVLWKGYQDRVQELIALMIKFGLLVPLHVNADQTNSREAKKWLVPALLPVADLRSADVANWSSESYNTCYFVFSTFSDFSSNTTTNLDDLRTFGFLPSGLFERIVGKAILWCQATTKAGLFHISNVDLHRNVAVMCFGSQRFRIIYYAASNTIRADFEGRNPLVVHDRLVEIISETITECMKSLKCFTCLLYANGNVATEADHTDFGMGRSELSWLIPLDKLRSAAESRSVLNRAGGRKLMTDSEIKAIYGAWLRLFELRSEYDMFLSYRWGPNETMFLFLPPLICSPVTTSVWIAEPWRFSWTRNAFIPAVDST